jgi:hypothetical protein
MPTIEPAHCTTLRIAGGSSGCTRRWREEFSETHICLGAHNGWSEVSQSHAKGDVGGTIGGGALSPCKYPSQVPEAHARLLRKTAKLLGPPQLALGKSQTRAPNRLYLAFPASQDSTGNNLLAECIVQRPVFKVQQYSSCVPLVESSLRRFAWVERMSHYSVSSLWFRASRVTPIVASDFGEKMNGTEQTDILAIWYPPDFHDCTTT